VREDFQFIRKMASWVGLETWTPREKFQFDEALSHIEDEVAELMDKIEGMTQIREGMQAELSHFRTVLETIMTRPWNSEMQTVHGIVADALSKNPPGPFTITWDPSKIDRYPS
jgi:hypothetical protein